MLTPEQLEIRRHGVTASEVAAVCGLNPWRTAHQVMVEKKGLVDRDFESNAAIVRGEIKEPMIVRWYEATTGKKVRYHGRHQRTVVKPDDPLVIGTPDGTVGTTGLVEAKAAGRRTLAHWGQPGTDEIPEYYIPQGIWQMAATGRRWVDFAVDLGDELGIYRLKWNPQLYDVLRAHVGRFWEQSVLGDEMPDIDGSPGCTAALTMVYATVKEPLAEASGDEEKLIDEYQYAKEQYDAWLAAKELAANRLRGAIGERKGYQSRYGKVVWSEVKGRTKVNWEALAKDARIPEDLIQKHTSIGRGYRTLRTYWAKEEL